MKHDRLKDRELIPPMLRQSAIRKHYCYTNSIPKELASAVWHQALKAVSTVKKYQAGKPITGELPDSKLHEAFREKLQKFEGTFFPPREYYILELFGITGEILEKVVKQRRRAQTDMPIF